MDRAAVIPRGAALSISPAIRKERAEAARAARPALLALLAAHGGNHRAAAMAAGVHVSTLRSRLRLAGVTAEETRELHPLAERQPTRPR